MQIKKAESEYLDQAYDLFCSHRSQPWSIDLFSRSFLQEFSMMLCAPSAGSGQRISTSQKKDLLGYIIVSNLFDEAEIEDICIQDEYRKQGMAKQLLAACILTLVEAGINKVLLEVRESNLAAIKLYQQQGFVQIAQRANYYVDDDGQTENALIFQYTC